MAEMSKQFPDGMKYAIRYDTTLFVREAIRAEAGSRPLSEIATAAKALSNRERYVRIGASAK